MESTRNEERSEGLSSAPDGAAIHSGLPAASPSGLPVLVVPGFGESAEEFEGLLVALRPRPAVALSVRGRGKSDAPAAGYAWEDHIGDLEAVVARLGWPHMSVVAFSRGSSYALGFSLRHPHAVRAWWSGITRPATSACLLRCGVQHGHRVARLADAQPDAGAGGTGRAGRVGGGPVVGPVAELTCPILLLRPGPAGPAQGRNGGPVVLTRARRLAIVDLPGPATTCGGPIPRACSTRCAHSSIRRRLSPPSRPRPLGVAVDIGISFRVSSTAPSTRWWTGWPRWPAKGSRAPGCPKARVSTP